MTTRTDSTQLACLLDLQVNMPELPFELWTKIASYIPESQMLSLCGVNRPFFEYVMNLRYRDMHLGGIHDEQFYVALS